MSGFPDKGASSVALSSQEATKAVLTRRETEAIEILQTVLWALCDILRLVTWIQMVTWRLLRMV